MSILMSKSLIGQVNVGQEEVKPKEVKLSAFFYFGAEHIEQEVKRVEWDQNSEVKLVSVSIYGFDIMKRFEDLVSISIPEINLEIKKISMCGFIIAKSNNYEYELIINTQ